MMEANVAEECEDTPVFIIGAGPATPHHCP